MSRTKSGRGQTRVLLLRAVVVAAISISGVATAQTARSASASDNEGLQEIVITATRHSDTIHNVAMSVTAVTSDQLEGQGLKTAQDIARTVPALIISPTNGGNTESIGGLSLDPPSVSIRGIGGGQVPTTGIYVDDVPLQQRQLNSPQGGGGLFPQLFDLDRVEVLRGPQGTLYGGYSEAGTMRFITRQPDFDNFTAHVRGEVSSIEFGGVNQETGGSMGGPIVSDKLAVLFTAWHRADGGWIDHVSRFSGATIAKDTNTKSHDLVRAQLAYKPVDNVKLTLSYTYNDNQVNDADTIWNPMAASKQFLGPIDSGHPQGVPYTYGPYKFGTYTTLNNTNVGDNFYTSDGQLASLPLSHYDVSRLPSLIVDWDLGKVNAKLVSSYYDLYNRSIISTSYTDIGGQSCATLVPPGPPFFLTAPLNCGGGGSTLDFFATVPVYDASVHASSKVAAYTEELRFSSQDPDSSLSWVGGLYFNRNKTTSDQNLVANPLEAFANIVFGAPGPSMPVGTAFSTQQDALDKQFAAFGEGTFTFGKLRVTAGLRFTRSEFSYTSSQVAPLFGQIIPDIYTGSITEKPLTPKAGWQYVFNSNANVYLNAAKGYRPGGINAPATPDCQQIAMSIGLPARWPDTFKSDSLWSYELGTKLRMWDGRASVNASIYRIDWHNVQTAIQLPAGACQFTSNAAKAVSQGGDIDAMVLLFSHLTLGAQVAYTDAKYRGDVTTGPFLTIADGDRIAGIPKLNGDVSARFTFNVLERSSYLRLDYQFRGGVTTGYGPGTLNYAPDQYSAVGSSYFTTLRAGVLIDKVDLSMFVDNVTDNKDLLSIEGSSNASGRSGCSNAACTSFLTNRPVSLGSTWAPRTIGISASYRY